MNNPFGFGGIKSPPDYRNIPLASVVEPTVFPKSFFIDIEELPVENQRKIGACVGHAFAKYKQLLDLHDTGKIIPLSPRFLYAIAKARDGVSGEGTFPRLVAKILKDVGCSTTDTVPNDTTIDHESYVYQRDETKIPKAALDEAYKAQVGGYAFPEMTKDGFKQAIYQAQGAALLMRIGQEWWTRKDGAASWQQHDIVPLRPPKEIVSGHEVYLYGYEDTLTDTKFYIFNSWSTAWGDKGKAFFYWSEYKAFLDEAVTLIDIPDHLLEEAHILPAKFKHVFTTPMEYGQVNMEVKMLQRALAQEGLFSAEATSYYGDATARAVLAFQKKYLTLSVYEEFILKGKKAGPKTLKKLNELYG